jgi:hypothetical protein
VTFKQVQDRVLARHNLTSDDARTRVKAFINERTRRIQTSTNLKRTRRDTVTKQTVSGSTILIASGVVHVLGVNIDNKMLGERTITQIRNYDPDRSLQADPDVYAIYSVQSSSLVLRFYPIPWRALDVRIDCMVAGTDMSGDSEVPGFPEDFHDALLFGASADEYDHQEKTKESLVQEGKFEKRLSDLRYWMATSALLARGQNSDEGPASYQMWRALHV